MNEELTGEVSSEATGLRRFRFVLVPVLLLTLPAIPSCSTGRVHTTVAGDDQTTSFETVVEMDDPEEAAAGSIPVQADALASGNTAEDAVQPEVCPCVCVKDCDKPGKTVPPELQQFLGTLQTEVEKRTEAAVGAILSVGEELVEQPAWREIVSSAITLLANPTIIVVQLSSGEWQKVKLDSLPELDVDKIQVLTLQKSIGGKMKAMLEAEMVSLGVPEKKAGKIAGAMIDTYMSELL